MRRSWSWSRSTKSKASSMTCARQPELEGLVDQWQVAQMLVQNIPYRQIGDDVSTATIVRVAQFLNSGNDGYRTIMRRQGKIDG